MFDFLQVCLSLLQNLGELLSNPGLLISFGTYFPMLFPQGIFDHCVLSQSRSHQTKPASFFSETEIELIEHAPLYQEEEPVVDVMCVENRSSPKQTVAFS
jgi:hypothetical protein